MLRKTTFALGVLVGVLVASQTQDRGHGLGPVLSPGVIAHFTRAMEVLLR